MSFYALQRCAIVALILLPSILDIHVHAGTIADDLKSLENGNAKVLLGAFVGEVSAIRKGLNEGGNVSAVMDPFMGEAVLKIGKVFGDFPLAPAVHIAFHQGDKKHLEAAFFLMIRGADINVFNVETNKSLEYSASYPPAILYSLGLGKSPRNSHAAFLRRLYISLKSHFNFNLLEEWRLLTGNPPLIHIAALADFFDGVYVLVNDFKFDVNAVDQNNLTVLHIAAWNDDHYLCRFLLRNGANVMMKDAFGRTAFHYAAMRGNIEFMSHLLDVIGYQNMNVGGESVTSSEQSNIKLQVLFAVDNTNNTALDLSTLYPPSSSSIQYLQFQLGMIGVKQNVKTRVKPLGIKGRKLVDSIPDSQPGDGLFTRGGWDYFSLDEPSDPCLCDTTADCTAIDIVTSAISIETFRNDYFSVQRPVLITDHIAAKQGIWAYWQREEFLARYGDMEVALGEKVHAPKGAWSLPMPLVTNIREYVGQYMSYNRSLCENLIKEIAEISNITDGTERNLSEMEIGFDGGLAAESDECSLREACYPKNSSSDPLPASSLSSIPSLSSTPSLSVRRNISGCNNLKSSPWVAVNMKASRNNPTWQHDFRRPSLFNLCGDTHTDDESMKLLIGPRGSGVPMGSHSAHWDLLVTGVKRWFLVPPGTGIEPAGAPNEMGNHKVPSVGEWMKDVFPDLLSRGLVSTFVQYPGDAVFVPHDW